MAIQINTPFREHKYSNDSKLLIHLDTKSCPIEVDNHESITIAQAMIDLIDKYRLVNRIVALSCDTEITNTGRMNGVCLQIERCLDKELLYCMCRHRIYELILKHVGEYIFGATSGQTFNFDSMSLKRSWETLDLDDFAPHVDETMNPIFFKIRESSKRILLEQMNTKMTRDDYSEFTDLALKFFGESDTEKKQFIVPSGRSNARWMQKGIYSIKAYLFRDQIKITDRAKHRLFSKLNLNYGPRTAHSIRYISNETIFSTLQIHEFITNRSMYLFSILQLDISFLDHNAETWNG